MNQTTEILERRLAENPRSPLFSRVAELYITENRLDEALTLCQAGVELFPYYPTGHLILARILYKLGRAAEALLEMEKVRRFVPDATTIAEELERLRNLVKPENLNLNSKSAAVSNLTPAQSGTGQPPTSDPVPIPNYPASPASTSEKPEDAMHPLPNIPVPPPPDKTLASPTLAKIYEDQGLLDKALETYEQTYANHPVPDLLKKIESLREQLKRR